MKSNTFRCFAVAVCIGLPAWTVSAQIEKRAQVGFRFLENPVSAEAIGRGGIGVTAGANALAVFWNPALISWNPTFLDVAIHHTSGIADIGYNALAGAFNIAGVAHVAFGLLVMDYGEFAGTRRAPNAEGFEETGSFSPKAYAFGVTFSQKVSDRFSYGVQAKVAVQDLGSAWVGPRGGNIADPFMQMETRAYRKSEYAFDVGAMYDFGFSGARFGAMLQNVSREVRYENDRVPLPFAVSFGASIEPIAFVLEGTDTGPLVISFESRHPRDYSEKLKFGVEYTFSDMIIVRAGYMTNYDERGFVAGLGVRRTFESVPVRFDYAYQPFGLFGSVHHLTLGLSY